MEVEALTLKHRNEQKVAVAYPHPAEVSAKFHRSLLHLFVFDALGMKNADGKKVGGRRRILDGGAHIPVLSGAQITKTRNRIVREFLALDGIDWLWCIDADMTFEPTVLEELLASAHPEERPIVGGLCFAYLNDQPRKLWPTLFGWVQGTNTLRRLTQYPADALVPVAATGAACLLIHRTVLEAVGAKYPPPWPWFAETPFYQEDGEGNPVWDTGDAYSEDITFCLRAQACGFPVYVNTAVKVGHVKEFVADEAGFIAECAALQEASVPALPTYVVMAAKNRHEMTTALADSLAPQATEVFIYDNGSTPPFDTHDTRAIRADGWPLHRMWNDGLDRAQHHALALGAERFNVLVVNNDVEVPPDFLARLEAGLRSHDDIAVSYPNHHGVELGDGEVAEMVNNSLAGQTMSGWAFMLRGEEGPKFDEAFAWWYGDTDLERRLRTNGRRVVAVGGCYARHLDPMRSTFDNDERLAQAQIDEQTFAAKWELDPAGLYFGQKRA